MALVAAGTVPRAGVSLFVSLPAGEAERAAAFLESGLATACRRAEVGTWALPSGCGPTLPLTIERAPATTRAPSAGAAVRLLLRSAGRFEALVAAARQAALVAPAPAPELAGGRGALTREGGESPGDSPAGRRVAGV